MAAAWAKTQPMALQRDDPGSMLNLHRQLLALRRQYSALATGAVEAVEADGAILSFRRRDAAATLQIIANTGDSDADVDANFAPVAGDILLSTHAGRQGLRVSKDLTIFANEALVVLIEGTA